MEINEALNLLKNIVKQSAIEGQMHLDLTLAPAHQREKYHDALVALREAIKSGAITDKDAKIKLGLS